MIPTPSDALTDALDEVGGFIDDAQFYVQDIADLGAYVAIQNLIDAIKYLRLAATILAAEVGALNEVAR